jgi:hypothetical protein
MICINNNKCGNADLLNSCCQWEDFVSMACLVLLCYRHMVCLLHCPLECPLVMLC